MAVVIEVVGLNLKMARLRLQLTAQHEKRLKVCSWLGVMFVSQH